MVIISNILSPNRGSRTSFPVVLMNERFFPFLLDAIVSGFASFPGYILSD